jgi:hypothetical protein
VFCCWFAVNLIRVVSYVEIVKVACLIGGTYVEEKDNEQFSGTGLCKCPYCACCFCNDTDLKRHLDIYGTSKLEHAEEFRRIHGRLEHGSFSGPE